VIDDSRVGRGGGVHILYFCGSLSLGGMQTNGVGTAMVTADWVVLASLWEAPTSN
jgi:hypothetical protein